MRTFHLFLCCCFIFSSSTISCRKKNQTQENENDIVAAEKYYAQCMEALPDKLKDKYKPDWSKTATAQLRVGTGILVPDTGQYQTFFQTSFGGTHVFPTKGKRRLLMYRNASWSWEGLWISDYPDSNATNSGPGFSGLRVASSINGEWLGGYRYLKNKSPLPLRKPGTSNIADRVVEVCFYSTGYNYSVSDPTNGYYWEYLLGCVIVEQAITNEPSPAGDPGIPGAPDLDNAGAAGGYNTPDGLPYYYDISNFQIISGNNIIGDLADYNKCFNNIAGNEHHYSVTICVEQPVPGTRESWGFTRKVVDGSSDLVSGGHSFIILKESTMNGDITRNVGFYPKFSASPFQPIDQGQLVNDAEHDYNIALTIQMTSSQFTQLLDFVNHGNDPGNEYNLNSNNCTSFVITALRRAGFYLPFTASNWLNGGGFNPGDMGEDIRSMILMAGMTRTELVQVHPNTGICY